MENSHSFQGNIDFENTFSETDELINIIRQYSAYTTPLPTKIQPATKCLHNIKVVLFDIYGTLFISGSGDIGTTNNKRDFTNLFTTAFEKAGLQLLNYNNVCSEHIYSLFFSSIQNTHKKSIQQGLEYPEIDIEKIWYIILRTLFKDKYIKTIPDPHTIRKIALYYEVLSNPVWPMPDLISVLDYLKESKMILGIISNAQFYTPLLFPAFFKKTHSKLGFKAEICTWSYKHGRAKPSLYLFELTLNKLSKKYRISPGNVLYIGNDMKNDIYPAEKVGFKTALFAGDKRSLRLRESDSLSNNLKPDIIVTKLDDLKNIINTT